MSRKGRISLTKTLLVPVIFVVCVALLGLVSLGAFSGLQESSAQEQTTLAPLQDDLGPAAPRDAQDAPDQPSDCSYLPEECMGPWTPLFIGLKEICNARAG